MIPAVDAIANGAGKLLGAIPWKVWVIAGAALAIWIYGEIRHDTGVAEEAARREAAQFEADRKAIAAQIERDTSADAIDDASTERAHEATTETRTETATAVERVNHETRTMAVPAGCPTNPPDRVRDEGRAAVARARAAGDPLRKGVNP